MSPSRDTKRPVRIAGCSGGFSDRVRAVASMAKDPEVDAIVGDWLSEMTMTMHGVKNLRNKEVPAEVRGQFTLEDKMRTAAYAETFLQCFEPAIDDLAKNKMKLCVNAGASDTELLAKVVQKMVQDKGHNLKVAWIEGDDVTEAVNRMIAKGEKFESLVMNKKLEEWGLDPVCAQCYLGGLGIAKALQQGADIVICGRVADAAPTIGVAAWWHDWKPSQLDELAGSLIAGHLIECSAKVTGGYFSGFKDIMKAGKHTNLGFPIAEVHFNGECTLVKEKDTGGVVSVGSVVSQLVYEIQGPWYYNSDVVADLTNIKIEQVGEDQVLISGVKGMPPPPTTKVGITAPAGFQAEFHTFLVGLDIEEKCRWTEDQIRYAIGDNISKFSLLKFHQNGSTLINAKNQDLATVDFRIFAQTQDPEILRTDIPNGLNRWVLETFLQSCPGLSLSNDLRQIHPKPYYEYWVSLIPQAQANHRVHCLFDKNQIIDMGVPETTKVYPRQQPSYNTSNPVDLSSFGETVHAPLGYVVMGRSGDKSSDANVGLFVRHDDEWDWLRTLLSTEKIKELLADEHTGKPVDRFEMANIRAVHFLLHDHLDRGYNASSTYDTLAKNVCEYIRSKTVDIPKKFLDRGRI